MKIDRNIITITHNRCCIRIIFTFVDWRFFQFISIFFIVDFTVLIISNDLKKKTQVNKYFVFYLRVFSFVFWRNYLKKK